MSVYKRSGAEVYSYDFQYRGHRFHGSTGCRNKKEAAKWEGLERQRVKASFEATTGPLTFAAAAKQFFDEVGQYRAKPLAVWSILGWLQRNIGPATPIEAIDNKEAWRALIDRVGNADCPSLLRRLADAEGCKRATAVGLYEICQLGYAEGTFS